MMMIRLYDGGQCFFSHFNRVNKCNEILIFFFQTYKLYVLYSTLFEFKTEAFIVICV